jgi:hypothetical protein
MSNDTVELQCFFIAELEEIRGAAFIAESRRDALEMALRGFFSLYSVGELRVEVNRRADISGLAPGEVPQNIDAVKRGIYISVDAICPVCGEANRIQEAFDFPVYCCMRCEARMCRKIQEDYLSQVRPPYWL